MYNLHVKFLLVYPEKQALKGFYCLKKREKKGFKNNENISFSMLYLENWVLTGVDL